jgi:hypothetical protein
MIDETNTQFGEISELQVGDELLRLSYTGVEELDPPYNEHVHLKTYTLPDHVGEDLAVISIYEGYTTPPQITKRKGPIIDTPIAGSGYFVIKEEGMPIRIIPFRVGDPDPKLSQVQVTYAAGTHQMIVAGKGGAVIAERCIPAFTPGDNSNVNLETDPTIPRNFKRIARALVPFD